MTLLENRVVRGTLLLLSYLALALAMSYPLLLHFNSFAFAGTEDGAMSVWNLWWMKHALLDLGRNPLSTNYLFFPDGVNLVFHSLPKVVGLASLPIQYLAGVTVAYNTVLLLSFVLTGITTYWLAWHLIGKRLPAFLAGAFFAFSPFRWDQRSHLQLLATMLIPVYILVLIKAWQALADGGRRPWIFFGLGGAILGVIAYDSEYYSIFLLLFSAFFLLFQFPFRNSAGPELRRWLKLLAGLALAGAIFALLYLPMLLAAFSELAANGDYVTFPAGRAVGYSADVLSFIIPSQSSQFLGSYFNFFTASSPEVTFLGWLPLALAAVGAWRWRRSRDVRFWALAAVVFGILSLGPHIIVNSRITDLPGPYAIMAHLPLLKTARVPARFVLLTMLAVAILAGYGSGAAFARLRLLKGIWSKLAIPVAAGLILGVMFLEFRPWPDLTATAPPPVYAEIAASDRPGSVMILPLGWEAGSDVAGIERTFIELYQTTHERPMVNGMVARAPKDSIYRGVYTPVLDFLADPVELTPSGLDRDPAAIDAFMERYQVGFIVAHKTYPTVYTTEGFYTGGTDLTPEALARLDDYLVKYMNMEKFAETGEIVAYRRSRV